VDLAERELGALGDAADDPRRGGGARSGDLAARVGDAVPPSGAKEQRN